MRSRPVSVTTVFQTHILREVQQRKHEEHILLSVQQRAVVEVTVTPPISECELQGQGLKVSAHVGPGVRLGGLSPYAQGPTDAGPVDLFQELKNEKEKLETRRKTMMTLQEKLRNYRKWKNKVAHCWSSEQQDFWIIFSQSKQFVNNVL